MISLMGPEWVGIQIKAENNSRSGVPLLCALWYVCTAVCVQCSVCTSVCALWCVCSAVCALWCVHCGVCALRCVCTEVCLHQDCLSFRRFEMYVGVTAQSEPHLFRPQQPNVARLYQTAPKRWMRSIPEISC